MSLHQKLLIIRNSRLLKMKFKSLFVPNIILTYQKTFEGRLWGMSYSFVQNLLFKKFLKLHPKFFFKKFLVINSCKTKVREHRNTTTLISKGQTDKRCYLENTTGRYSDSRKLVVAVGAGVPKDNYSPSFTKCLRLTQVFMWNSALPEKFDFCFSRVVC